MSVTLTSRVNPYAGGGGGGVGQAAATTTSGMTTKPAFSETTTGKLVFAGLVLGVIGSALYAKHLDTKIDAMERQLKRT